MSGTQSGTIDGISYASTQNVYDPNGEGFVSEILYFDASGTQVAERNIFSVNPMFINGGTKNADGTFTLELANPGANGGIAKPYTLETFSSSGIWIREDNYTPIFLDASNPGGGVSGWTDTGYMLVDATGPGSSGKINGAYYDMVETLYDANGKLTETDYLNDLNGSSTVVAKQVSSQPDPILTVPPAATATAGTALALALGSTSLVDSWAASHAGSLALNISVDSGIVSGKDSAGNSFSASAGTEVHLTGTLAQINTDLAGLSFTGQAGTGQAGTGQAGTAHITFQVYDQAGVETSKQEIITVSAASSGSGSGSGSSSTPNPVLSGPTQLTIPTGTGVNGLNATFSDPWAVNHAGSLALNVTTTFGTLTEIAGPGPSATGTSLHLTGSYSQIEADIVGLALTSSQAGTGTVRIEVYDQAGVEAVHVIGVTAQAASA